VALTDKGIKTAEDAGIALIGFPRGDRFSIYTPQRARMDPVFLKSETVRYKGYFPKTG
jgi:hypothetical protein